MQSVWKTVQLELREAVAPALPTIPPERIVWESPPDASMGDLALPCFSFAKELRQAPEAIAQRIAEQLAHHPMVARASMVGAYVNVVLDAAVLAQRVMSAVAEAGERYGDAVRDRPRSVVLEFISPNANKPLHLGHLRNAFLGEAIARMLEASGHGVHRVCLVNDRGVHIMKSMLAYHTWGAGSTPASEGIKGDHFVGNWYVEFERKRQEQRQELGLGTTEQQPPIEREAAEWLRKWEAGDPEVRALWERMTNWVLAGFRESYKLMGVQFEREYRESDIYEDGRRIVADALACGVLTKDAKGNVIAPLKECFGMDDKVVERADGTTVYATQDLALAAAKETEFHPDASIIITGNEQDFYFRQLFKIFEMIGIPGAATAQHRSYGMVELPEGKMKSREGTVVDADDLIGELEEMAREEIRMRATSAEGEVVVTDAALARARDIALAAIKFYLLLVTPESTVTFNPKESLAFTGKTGPYVQYMHARCCAMLRKAADQPPLPEGRGKMHLLVHPAEQQLLRMIAQFPDVIAVAADQLDPSTLTQFVYELAKTFADFYRDVPVLKAERELRAARLALVRATRLVLARSLTLLGMTPLEEM
ncbi:arginine--tRNA ligase [Candidatus Uhrbacteria bacterium]|nr:arginine--tRNA ligase [Candidatus Uhrbacteria bacterium]